MEPGWVGSTILETISQVAARDPARSAVVEPNSKLTYSGLNEKSAELRDELALFSCTGLAIVGTRASDSVVALVAALTSGTPVFVDKSLPHLIQKFEQGILRHAGISHVYWKGRMRLLPGLQYVYRADPQIGPACLFTQTSGTTGAPKISAQAFVGIDYSFQSRLEYYGPQSRDLVNLMPLGSDSALVGLIWPYLCGGTLRHLSSDQVDNALGSEFSLKDRTILCIPEIAEILVDEDVLNIRSASELILAGSPLMNSVADSLCERMNSTRIVNEYGPSECSIWTSVSDVRSSSDNPSIGVPLPGTTYSVADGSSSGVLAITGPGVGLGYIDRHGLHPFDEQPDVFVTSDIVESKPDGSYMFAGRANGMAISGFTIDPKVIERALLKHPLLNSCSVRIDERGGLIAEYDAGFHSVEIPDLHQQIEKELPTDKLNIRFQQV